MEERLKTFVGLNCIQGKKYIKLRSKATDGDIQMEIDKAGYVTEVYTFDGQNCMMGNYVLKNYKCIVFLAEKVKTSYFIVFNEKPHITELLQQCSNFIASGPISGLIVNDVEEYSDGYHSFMMMLASKPKNPHLD